MMFFLKYFAIFGHIFYPARFVVLVCFSDSLAGLLNWPFLNYVFWMNPFSMYTTETKLSFS